MVQISRVCPVIGSPVTVVVDRDRDVTTVICPHHLHDINACSLRRQATAGGPLSQLVDRAAHGRYTPPNERCVLEGVERAVAQEDGRDYK